MTPEESQRFEALEQRILRLEARLGALPPPNVPPVPTRAPLIPAAAMAHVAVPTTRLVAPQFTPARPSATPVLPAKVPQARPAADPSLERALGLKWAGWAGAVALAISMALGVKYAYEQGWFANIPAGARALFVAFCGFALIAAGEVVYRKVNKLAASGLFGSGVAALFIAAYAGHAYYNLYPPATALWLVGLATLLGAALSMRGKLAAVGVLSILGAMLAPVIITTGARPGVPLLLYALVLQSLALFLSCWGNSEKWWALRMLALLSSVIWFMAVIFEGGTGDHIILALAVLSGVLFQSELAISTLRGSVTVGPPQLLKRASDSAGALFSIFVTALLCVAGLCLLSHEIRTVRVLWVLALALFFGVQSALLPSWIGARAEALAQSFRTQAALLALTAVPVALDGQALAMGWALMGVGFAWLAQKQKTQAVLIFAGVALSLASVTWFFEAFRTNDAAAAFRLEYAFSLASIVLMAAFYVSGCFVRKLEGTAPGLSNLRILFWAALPLIFFWDVNIEIHRYFHPRGPDWLDVPASEHVTLSVFWGLLAISLVLLGFMWKTKLMRYGGLALFAFTLFKIVSVDGSYLGSGYRVLSFLGVGALLLATSVVYGKLSKEF